MYADLLLTNGRVYTMDADVPHAESIAVAGNRILAVGTQAALDALRGPQTHTIDLRGRLLLPAFADSHIHLEQYSLDLQQLDLRQVASAGEAAAIVGAAVAAQPRGSWLRGIGWDRNVWDDPTLPSRELLDQVAPHHPTALASKDLHSLWVNALALAAAGITADTPDPRGGVIVRDQLTGQPTGILLEKACKLVTAVYPRPTVSQCADAIRQALPALWAEGIVSAHQMGDAVDARAFRALQYLQGQGDLALRVCYYLPSENLDSAIQLGLRSGLGDHRLRVGGVKLFADGSLGSHTAWMLDPFDDEPGNCGVPWLVPAALREEIGRASQNGLAVAVHALGDRANREVIDAIAGAGPPGTRDPVSSGRGSAARAAEACLRHRIEHAQLLQSADIHRMARHHITASMQPIHATSDMIMAGHHWGEPRNQGAYAWRSVLDQGAPLCFGSDAPVESFSILAGIHAAVTRRRPDGTPGLEGWHPEQRLTVAEAVHAYTLGAAAAVGEEQTLGSLTPGKLADLVVLSEDIFHCDPMAILDTDVDLTILDGRVVYSRDGEALCD